MKYFFDTEFIEDGKTIDLISIGIVAADGREFYAENASADHSNASDWVKENVLKHLWSRSPEKSPYNAWIRDGGAGGLLFHKEIAWEVKKFLGEKPEIYAYYADYDWVAFCQLFGTMMDLPDGYPMYCRDLKQTLDEYAEQHRVALDSLKQHPAYPKQDNEHNALDDAKWNRELYLFLQVNQTASAA